MQGYQFCGIQQEKCTIRGTMARYPSNKTTKRELQDLIINLRELELDTLPNQLQINNYMKKISSNELKDNKWGNVS